MMHEDMVMQAIDADEDGRLTVLLARAQRVREPDARASS